MAEVVAGMELLGARGRPGHGPATHFVRALTEEDLREAVAVAQTEGLPKLTAPSALQKIRASHRELARLLAMGATQVEASMLTGYHKETINRLLTDPAFQELMAYYDGQREEVYEDAHRLLATLGTEVTAELLDRVRDSPDKIGTTTLIDMAKMALDRSVAPPKTQARPGGFAVGVSPAGAGAGVNIQINFVDTPGEDPGGGTVLDLVPERVP